SAFIRRCHRAGQRRPTPLLLQYGAEDYNCLHQDLYGEHVFPLQLTLLLSTPGRDFTGGEFVLTEQRPRMQSRAEVVPIGKADAVGFAVNAPPPHRRQRRALGEPSSRRHHLSRRRMNHAAIRTSAPSTSIFASSAPPPSVITTAPSTTPSAAHA